MKSIVLISVHSCTVILFKFYLQIICLDFSFFSIALVIKDRVSQPVYLLANAILVLFCQDLSKQTK